MKKLLILLVGLMLIGAAIFYVVSRQVIPGKPVTEEPSTSTTTYTFTASAFKTETLTYNEAPVRVAVDYPQFKDAPDNSVAALINKNILAEASQLYANNLKELQDNAESFKEMGVDTSDRELIFERKLEPETIYINSSTNTLSFSYTNYYDGGGAHGTFFYRATNFDLKTGDQIKLGMALKGTYEKFLANYVTNIIKNPTKDCENCESLDGNIADFASSSVVSDQFILNAKGLTLLYSAYDLGAYVSTAGGQQIFVPKTALKDYINRDW